MCLVQDQVAEVQLVEEATIVFARLPLEDGVGGEHHVDVSVVHGALDGVLHLHALALAAVVGVDHKGGTEALQLVFPIGQGGCRHHD